MAYFGKVFTIEKRENIEDFFRSIDMNIAEIKVISMLKPTEKIEKDGDGYIFTTTNPGKEVRFKNGDTVLEAFGPLRKANATWTVDGDVYTQVVDFDKHKVTYRREFSENQLILTLTNTSWDGKATVWFKA